MRKRKFKFEFFSFFTSRFVFGPAISFLFYDLHIRFSAFTFNLKSLVFGGSVLRKNDLIHLFPDIWGYVLIGYRIITFLGIFFMIDIVYRNLVKKLLKEKEEQMKQEDVHIPAYPYNEDKLQMIVGLRHSRLSMEKVNNPEWIIVDEKGMYQNFLITGTIGTGKTASGMYPFVKQAMFYKAYDKDMKPGMLILDVKGNFYKQVLAFAEEAGRLDDVVIIGMDEKWKYNAVHKPHLKPLVLANRSKTVLTLFSPKGSSDGYWLDKSELLIAECIKLCRLYNKGYVTFSEINRLVNVRSYLDEKLSCVIDLMEDGILSNEDEEQFETCREYFENEYANLSENTLSIIQSVVTQMTQFFYTDPEVRKTFCPAIDDLNFYGFRDVIDKGKIVILKMNISEYRNVAKTVAAYMKLDFQSEVMQRLVRDNANTTRPVYMFCDEYQEFVTSTDAEFYAQSREPKCVNVVATQSYTSLINTLRDRDLVRTVTQNLINKIWLRTDDLFTVEEAQKQLGKEDKEKITKSISESSGDVKKSRILGALTSDKSSVSESVNISTIKDFIFDAQLFTQVLDVFTGICFLSDGAKIIEPSVVHLQPYFNDVIKYGIKSGKVKRKDQKAIPDKGLKIDEQKDIAKEVVLKEVKAPVRGKVISLSEKVINLNERGIKGYEQKGKADDYQQENQSEEFI